MAAEVMDTEAQSEYLNQHYTEKEIRDDFLSLLQAVQRAEQFYSPLNSSDPKQTTFEASTIISPG